MPVNPLQKQVDRNSLGIGNGRRPDRVYRRPPPGRCGIELVRRGSATRGIHWRPDAYAGARAMSTGGLGLIGSATARRLVALGAEVLLVDSMITSPAIIFRENSASASRPRLRRLRAKILAPRCIYPCQCSCSARSAGRRWRGPGVFRPRAMMRRI